MHYLSRDRHISQVKRLRGFLGNNAAFYTFFFRPAAAVIPPSPTSHSNNGLRASAENFSENLWQGAETTPIAVTAATSLDETDTGP